MRKTASSWSVILSIALGCVLPAETLSLIALGRVSPAETLSLDRVVLGLFNKLCRLANCFFWLSNKLFEQ